MENTEEKPKHVCGQCTSGFMTEEEYLRHLCPVTETRPGGEIEEVEDNQTQEEVKEETPTEVTVNEEGTIDDLGGEDTIVL